MHEEDRVLEAVELALRQARLSLLRLGELLGRGSERRACLGLGLGLGVGVGVGVGLGLGLGLRLVG